MQTYTVEVQDNGTKCWYLNGKLHREDGPAVEWSDGTKRWYRNGKLHREDGPACEFADGTKRWYIDGLALAEEGFNNKNKTCNGKIVTIDGKQYKLQEVK